MEVRIHILNLDSHSCDRPLWLFHWDLDPELLFQNSPFQANDSALRPRMSGCGQGLSSKDVQHAHGHTDGRGGDGLVCKMANHTEEATFPPFAHYITGLF